MSPTASVAGFQMQPTGDLSRRPRVPQISFHPRRQDRIRVDLVLLWPGTVNVSFAFNPAAITTRSSNVTIRLHPNQSRPPDQGGCYEAMTPPSASFPRHLPPRFRPMIDSWSRTRFTPPL